MISKRNKARRSGRADALVASLIIAWLSWAGWVPAASAAAPQRTYAYSWRPVAGTLENIVPFHWLRWSAMARMDAAIKDAIAATRAMPRGHRVLFSWDMHRIMAYHSGDAVRDTNGKVAGCMNKDGRKSPYHGLWWDQGRRAARERFSQFFTRYAAAGGDLDVLILDFEDVPITWYLNQHAQRLGCDLDDYFAAIQNDPRFAALSAELGFTDLSPVVRWYASDHYLRWNAAMHRRFTEDINQALFTPVREAFPRVKMANYGAYYQDPSLRLLDLNGHDAHKYFGGGHVGTHQSRELYGWLGNVAQAKLDGVVEYGKSTFNAFRYAVNKMRAMKLSSNVPVYPWISHKEFDESLLSNSDLYQELIFHIGLTGVEQFLYWNPHSVTPPASADSDRLVSDTLREFDEVLGNGDRQSLMNELAGWSDAYVVTGMRAGARTVWRLTPRLGGEASLAALLVSPDPATFRIGGKLITVPGARVLPRAGVSAHGFWLVAEDVD